jgi:hypothetical protein
MPDITYATRISVLRDAMLRTHEVGAYQAREWLESYLTYLEIKENEDSTGTRNSNAGNAGS